MKLKKIAAFLLAAALLSACTPQTAATEPVATEGSTETVAEPVTEAAVTEASTEEATEQTETQTESTAAEVKAADFWLEDETLVKTFTGAGKGFSLTTEYTDVNLRQERKFDGETEASNAVYEKRDDSIVMVAEGPEKYFRQNLLNGINDPEQNWLKQEVVILKDPITEGATWMTGQETEAKIEKIFPAAEGHKVRVVVSYLKQGVDGRAVSTFEEGLGVVEDVYELPEGTETLTMTNAEEGRPASFISLYYPSGNAEGLVRKDTYHVFEPNSITRQELEKLLKDAPASAIPTLRGESVINSLYRNKYGNVYIDLNQAFVDQMGGSSGESLTLDALAYTVGGLFQGKAVVVTIDNGPYEGGHVTLGAGDTLSATPEEDKIVEVISE